jgi:hypothetical protein
MTWIAKLARDNETIVDPTPVTAWEGGGNEEHATEHLGSINCL